MCLAFLIFFEGSTSQKIIFAMAQTLTLFPAHLQTHLKIIGYAGSLPLILDPDLSFTGECKILKSTVANSSYCWLVQHQD